MHFNRWSVYKLRSSIQVRTCSKKSIVSSNTSPSGRKRKISYLYNTISITSRFLWKSHGLINPRFQYAYVRVGAYLYIRNDAHRYHLSSYAFITRLSGLYSPSLKRDIIRTKTRLKKIFPRHEILAGTYTAADFFPTCVVPSDGDLSSSRHRACLCTVHYGTALLTIPIRATQKQQTPVHSL